MIKDAFEKIELLRSKYPHAIHIIVGDMNLSRVKWEFGETQGALDSSCVNVRKFEREFLSMSETDGLFQLNSFPNNAGNFLDLVFASTIGGVHVSRPTDMKLQQDAHLHSDILVSVDMHRESRTRNAFSKTIRNINLKKTAALLRTAEAIPQCLQSMANEESISHKTICTKAITNVMLDIQSQSESKYVVNHSGREEGHPWTVDKEYSKLVKLKRHAKKKHALFPTEENKLALGNAHRFFKANNG